MVAHRDKGAASLGHIRIGEVCHFKGLCAFWTSALGLRCKRFISSVLLGGILRFGDFHLFSVLIRSFVLGVETTRHFLLEWLSYMHRYIPVGLLEITPQKLNWRPPLYYGRNDLESLMASDSAADWVD